jgi:hypothetical protein
MLYEVSAEQRTSPHRFVAIKFLREELTQNRQALERFQREAQAALAQTVQIFARSTRSARGNQPFIAMDCFDGQTLKQLIAGIPWKLISSLTSA